MKALESGTYGRARKRDGSSILALFIMGRSLQDRLVEYDGVVSLVLDLSFGPLLLLPAQ